jgi:hypothetical protein
VYLLQFRGEIKQGRVFCEVFMQRLFERFYSGCGLMAAKTGGCIKIE